MEQSLATWTVQNDMSLSPLTPNEIKERRALMMNLIRDVMKEGRDYGIIPGTEKRSLWKAGAEKLCTFLGFSSQIIPVETVLDWTGKEHDGEPFFFFRHKCIVRHGTILITEMEASCNSWEKKYRWREGKRVCPKCGKETIFRSKPRENDPPNKPMGFYCWSKRGGCGATFVADDKSITNQQVGIVKNEEIFDQVNTIQKMSEKRAFVGTTIIACNAGEFFALDLEAEEDNDLGDIRPTVVIIDQEPEQNPTEIKERMQAASKALRGDQGDIELGPDLTQDPIYITAHTTTQPFADRAAEPPQISGDNGYGETVKAASQEPAKPTSISKQATNKSPAFFDWCKTWITEHTDYADTTGKRPNMYHILGRVEKLGFAEITDTNRYDVIAALDDYVKGKIDAAQLQG